MSVLGKLASALGRSDDAPNQELAIELAADGNHANVAELASALSKAPKPTQNCAIKVLYELAALRPELVAPHAEALFLALKSRNNRLVWGALAALDALTATNPKLIAAQLPDILDAASRGSVIAKDKTVSILATLAAIPDTANAAWGRLLAILDSSEVNQTPMYAEAALRAAPVNDPHALAEVIRKRLVDVQQPAKLARLEKVLRKLAPIDRLAK